MTLLVISPDYASHLLPLLALARPWAAAGERVVVATGPAVAPIVAGARFERVPLVIGRGSNPGVARAEEQPAGEDERLRAFFRATHEGMLSTLRLQAQLRRRDLLWRPVEAARATIGVVEQVRPAAILVDHLAFGARLGLGVAGIRHADVVLGHPTALPVGSERYGVPDTWPRAFVPDAGVLGELRTLADDVDARFTADWNDALATLDPGATPVADAFRTHGEPVLFNYPAAIHDPDRTRRLPRGSVFLGSSVRAESLDPAAAAWLGHDPGRPMVVVSFGSFLSARDDVLARVVAALRGLDVRVALATGSASMPSLGELPDAWLVRPYLPQVALVAHASAAVLHGGNNGVTEALTHGTPVVALPFSTDQFAVAADLERAGLGLALDPNAAGIADLRAAIVGLLDGPARGAARALGAELHGDPGPERARRAVGTITAGHSVLAARAPVR